jgi:phage/plasmid-like protein (TIGR03299 family)
MAHELFGDRFFGRQTEPAWHNLGHVFDVELSARQALEEIGSYEVTLEPIYARIGKQRVTLPERAIVRHPTDDAPAFECFGTVGPEYVLITPRDACALFDEHVAQPIETMGALKEGRVFFFSTQLPAIDVKGDEVEMYQLGVVPMDGLHVAEIIRTGVRVVCANTLRAAQMGAGEASTFRVVHDATAMERFAEWLRVSYEDSRDRVATIKEQFVALADHKVTPRELTHVIEIAYPTPKEPRNDAPKEVLDKRLKLYQFRLDRTERYRVGAKACFKGEGVGQDSPAAKGTAWGLFNAISEYEQWGRKGSTRGEGEDANVSEELLFGSRALIVDRAFEECLALVK